MDTNWIAIAKTVSQLVTVAAPVVETLTPVAAPAVAVFEKILQGVIDAEPTATDLYNRIVSGADPTPEELQQFSSDYEASYQKLKDDIAKKLAATT